jgi:uncharacterized phiE125 gp8 family phage protein
MHYGISLEPIQSPVTAQEFANWLRLDEPFDPNIPLLLESATQKAMNYTGRAFVEQTITVQYDSYPGFGTPTLGLDRLREVPYRWIDLPYPRLISVDSVVVEDPDGNQTIILDYRVDTRSEPGRINFKGQLPAIGANEFLIIEYKAGYGSPCDVPAGVKIGIMKIAAYLYEHRGDCDPTGNPDLFADLTPYKIMRL